MPIYSDDPKEEARMLKIRDTPNDRVRMMAESRVASPRILPFNETELTWIGDEERHKDQPIPFLSPHQYWIMITTLAADLRRVRAQVDALEAIEQRLRRHEIKDAVYGPIKPDPRDEAIAFGEEMRAAMKRAKELTATNPFKPKE